MIRSSDDSSGKDPHPFDPHALFRSLERDLAKSKRVTEDKAYEAQQLVYDAWEAPTDEDEQLLILKALEIDPTNVDALLQSVTYAELDADEEIEPLRKIVTIAEKNLGRKMFKEYAGHFWGAIETRPYMRARERLAETLRYAGRVDEAIAEWQAMLELNPNDNQGIRYALLSNLLQLSRLDEARKLFERYPEEFEWNAAFAWGRVLERFLSDDLSGAEAALTVARKQNPYMQGYVKGHRSQPHQLPPAYSPGSKEEAACFAHDVRAAWLKHPAALKWLDTQKIK